MVKLQNVANLCKKPELASWRQYDKHRNVNGVSDHVELKNSLAFRFYVSTGKHMNTKLMCSNST